MRELYHHGILGMKWGVRRFQNPDGTLTPAGRRRLQRLQNRVERKDTRWARRNEARITKAAYKRVRRPLTRYSKALMQEPWAVNQSGRLSASAINAYNRKMAELMSDYAERYSTPSGKAVRFVAKRGGVGVMMAIADRNYNMAQVKNGVWTNGKIAYKSTVLERA